MSRWLKDWGVGVAFVVLAPVWIPLLVVAALLDFPRAIGTWLREEFWS